MKYTVHFDLIASYTIDVDADDVEQAIELARASDDVDPATLYVYERTVYKVTDENGAELECEQYL